MERDRDRNRLWRAQYRNNSATTSDDDTGSSQDSEIREILEVNPQAIEVDQRLNMDPATRQFFENCLQHQQTQQEQLLAFFAEERQARVAAAQAQVGVQAPGVAQAQPQRLPEPKLSASTFPELNMEGSEAEKLDTFVAWEAGVRNTATALDLINPDRIQFERVASLVLSSFRGQNATQAADLTGDMFQNMNGLMDTLRLLFCGAAVQEKSYNLFTEAAQRPNEDILSWASRLQGYWFRAFDQNDRSEAQLIRTFISGLKDKTVQKALLRRDQGIPDAYQDVKEVTLAIQGVEETVRLMDRDVRNKHRIKIDGRGVPMELGAVQATGGAPGTGNNPGGGRGGKNAVNQRVPKDTCLNCGMKGHWRRDCRNPKKRVVRVNMIDLEGAAGQNTHNGEDDDDEEEWGNLTPAGNAKAQV